jgi:hypothetical protein
MHHYWVTRGSFVSPAFNLLTSSEQITYWKTFGTILGLYVYYFKQWPRQFNPFIFLSLEGGSSVLDVSPDYLRHLDPITADKLSPWFEISKSDSLPTSLTHPFAVFLNNEINMQVFISGDLSSDNTR